MTQFFVNLKRFDIPRSLGGICPQDSPVRWIQSVMRDCVQLELGRIEGMQLVFLLPEALIFPAQAALTDFPAKRFANIAIGCQSVHREDVTPGGNFGAFTASRPASAMRAAGCTWAMLGHSEERKEKLGLLASYDAQIAQGGPAAHAARSAVSATIRQETERALSAGLRALVCVGETAEEKGEGSFTEQQPRIAAVLREQLEKSLPMPDGPATADNLVIAYEPIWAIGPGKTPPGAEYIAFVAGLIQAFVESHLGFAPGVVYGGGLKEENAAAIAGIDALGGGLVALTRFSGEIGFYPEELKKIVERYRKNEADR